MTRYWLVLFSLAIGCSDKSSSDTGPGDDTGAGDDTSSGGTDILTLANCVSSVTGDVPDFYESYFACVDLSVSGTDVVIGSDNLPPHKSPYWFEDSHNYVEFDDRGGDWWQIPDADLAAEALSFTIASDPTPKGITIDSSLVDNTNGTSDEEYPMGPAGIALDGITAFAAMAAPGDELADEAYTFDLYEGHPAFTTYHYHIHTPGPLEVLVDRGYSDTTEYGEGAVEMYGIMCDGTVIMGCTELDGSAPDDSDFDAQNGHVHDISDATGVQFTERYHTHVCDSLWPDYVFFPEIAYYDDGNCDSGPP